MSESGMSDVLRETEAAPPQMIHVANDTWTWVDFPDSRCANGTPTGIGVNPHAGATRILIFLQGGGACVDANSCWINPTADNIASGYGSMQFATELTLALSLFQRGPISGNPFADSIFVYVPYCTGDIHSGTHVANYVVNGKNQPTYHYGGHNVDLFFASLAASYPGLSRVELVGFSAGGFGTFMSQDFAARAFGGIRVDVYDDSGPPIQDDQLFAAALANWVPQFPPACTDCMTGFPRIFAYDRATYASSRYGFLTFQTDNVLPMFYGVTPQMFAAQIATLLQGLASDPNVHYFEALASGHVVSTPLTTAVDPAAGLALMPWVTKMATDDPTWASGKY